MIEKKKESRKRALEQEESDRSEQTKKQIENVISLLEKSTDPIKVQTTDVNSDAKKYLETFFKFTAWSTPDDVHYHSIWEIDFKE